MPAPEAARVCERRQRTGWSPRRLAEEPNISRSHSRIHQVLRRGGCSRREYVHSILDDCSRLAYSQINADETAATATAFACGALDWFLVHGI